MGVETKDLATNTSTVSFLQNKLITALLFICLALILAAFGAVHFMRMHEEEPIYAGPGVTEKKMLSDYFSPLAGTPGDTEVYILEGENPGGTLLLLGGVHPNEPAGLMAAVVLIENVVMDAGRLIVIPRSNNSAYTHNDAQEGAMQRFEIETPGGKRWFRYGSRATNYIHQWPNPDVYVHTSGQLLSGSQIANLNRVFPGRPDGVITEQIAYAITELIKKEDANITIDLHEASPEYPVNHAIVSHQDALHIGVEAVVELEMMGIGMKLEISPISYRGLSHRELGDHTDTYSFLFETPNPGQGRLRDGMSEDLVVKGISPHYQKAAKMGILYVPFDETGQPMERRVVYHLASMQVIADKYTMFEGNPITFKEFPDWTVMEEKGLGAYLFPPQN